MLNMEGGGGYVSPVFFSSYTYPWGEGGFGKKTTKKQIHPPPPFGQPCKLKRVDLLECLFDYHPKNIDFVVGEILNQCTVFQNDSFRAINQTSIPMGIL